MKNYSYKESLQLSMARTRQMLLSPFNLKKWLKLIFIGIFAGTLLNSGMNGGFPSETFTQPQPAEDQVTIPAPAGVPSTTPAVTSSVPAQTQTTLASTAPASQTVTAPDVPTTEQPATPGPLFWVVVMVLVPLSLFLIWIGSRMQFVWLHSIFKNHPEIKAPFKQYKSQGNSLFKFALIFPFALLAIIALILALPIFLGYQAGAFQAGFEPTTMQMIFLIAAPLAILIALFFAIVFMMICVQTFVFPIMAFDNISFIPALKKWHLLYKRNKGEMWKYFFLRVLIGILQLVVELVLMVAAALVILIPGAIIIALFYFIFIALMKAMTVFVIAASLAAIPLAVFFIAILMAARLPFAVFYQNLSFNVLASFDSTYPRANPE